MSDKPNFATDGRDWPHREASRFVKAANLTFHVQSLGEGPQVVLLHGMGASTHSFDGLIARLAADHEVIAFDLPGHGFTETPLFTRMTIPGIAEASAALLATLRVDPVAIVAHSAGAQIAIRMALDGRVQPRVIIGINASLRPFSGMLQPVFSSLAKLLFVNPLTPRLFAMTVSRGRVRKLLADTGSVPSEAAVARYYALFRKPGHVAGALSMMAGADLDPLLADLAGLAPELVLVAAANDRTVPPTNAAKTASAVPNGRVVRLPRLGHLAHEEAPGEVAAVIREAIAGPPVSATGSG